MVSSSGRPAALLTVAVVAALVAGSSPAAAQERWRDLLQRVFDAGRQRPYDGRLVVVSFRGDGPVIGEVAVARTRGGAVLTGRSESWMVGRVGRAGYVGDRTTGTLLEFGGVEPAEFSVERLTRKYDVVLAGGRPGPTGPATVVELSERSSGRLRERLYIDPDVGVIVRRETYAGEEQPLRLAAFTELKVSDERGGAFSVLSLPPGGDTVSSEGTAGQWVRREQGPRRASVSSRGIGILEEVGWVVPQELPGGFSLLDAGAVGEGEQSSLHLLYGDGLYLVSIYQQHGRLDESAVVARGAEPTTVGGFRVLEWPGSEPTTLLWSAEGMTFTAVSDAPGDMLATALEGLPRPRPVSLLSRLRRGVGRGLDLLWPFD